MSLKQRYAALVERSIFLEELWGRNSLSLREELEENKLLALSFPST